MKLDSLGKFIIKESLLLNVLLFQNEKANEVLMGILFPRHTSKSVMVVILSSCRNVSKYKKYLRSLLRREFNFEEQNPGYGLK